MNRVQRKASGSLKCGPDLYARKCEGGYELWKAEGKYEREWLSYGVVDTKKDAEHFLLSWFCNNLR